MRKIILTLVTVLMNIVLLNAQTIKSYSGTYKLSYWLLTSGQATYKYYEKNGKEIKQGAFTFSTSSTKSNLDMSITISGNYDEDLKTGLWNYSATFEEKSISKTVITLKANYKEGLPNGVWTATLKPTSLKDNVTANSKLVANFSNGCFVNDFDFTFSSPDETSEIIIKLDDVGNYISYKNKKNQNLTTNDYYKNVLITDKIGLDKTKEIVDKIELYSNNQDTLNEIPYKLIKKQGTMPDATYDLIFNFLFLFEDIKGDVNYVKTDYNNNVTYNYDGFYYYVLEEQKTTTDFYNDYIAYGDKSFKSANYEKAIEHYNKALTYKKLDYALNQITECNKKIKEIEEEKLRNYNLFIFQADSLLVNYKFVEAKGKYESALKYNTTDLYATNQIKIIKDYQTNTNKYYQKGYEFSKNNMLDSAIHYYKISYYFYPKNMDVLNSLGWTLILNKNFDQALSLFENGISLTQKTDKNYPYLLGNLAHCYLFNNNVDKAKEIYYNNLTLKVGDLLWADAVVADFNLFIEKGINSDYYLEIAKKLKKKKELNLKK